jgi:hypothetical protein
MEIRMMNMKLREMNKFPISTWTSVSAFDYAWLAISRALAHSGQSTSVVSVMKPLPTKEVVHWAHVKHSLCQCRSSNDMNFVPPMPAPHTHRLGLAHAGTYQ